MEQSPGTGSVRTVRSNAEHGNEEEGAVPGLAGLTPREIEVLILVARGATHRECAARLGIKPKTLDNHKTRLMRDLGLAGKTGVNP